MAVPLSPLIAIPARMASSRLPGKPLADICGVPMIVQVLRRCREADIGPVVVACAEAEIADAVTAADGVAIMTDPDLASGSDRIWQAVSSYDPQGAHAVIINVQGDLPTLDPSLIRVALDPLADPAVDIATLAAEASAEDRDNPNVVKIAMDFPDQNPVARAYYFTRATVPWGDGPVWHHIGLYAYRREALCRFVSLPPSPLEQRERLEQLRAIENGMRLDVVRVRTVPLGVDTPDDLEKARRMLGAT